MNCINENKSKVCSKCKETKTLDQYSLNRPNCYRAECKTCQLSYNKRYRKDNPHIYISWENKNRERRNAQRRERRRRPGGRNADKVYISKQTPEKRKEYKLKANYGITLNDYNEILRLQHGVCAICASATPGRAGSYLHVDHCHITKKVRGLLCDNCNKGLGHFRDTTSLLNAAIKYLEK